MRLIIIKQAIKTMSVIEMNKYMAIVVNKSNVKLESDACH